MKRTRDMLRWTLCDGGFLELTFACERTASNTSPAFQYPNQGSSAGRSRDSIFAITGKGSCLSSGADVPEQGTFMLAVSSSCVEKKESGSAPITVTQGLGVRLGVRVGDR